MLEKYVRLVLIGSALLMGCRKSEPAPKPAILAPSPESTPEQDAPSSTCSTSTIPVGSNLFQKRQLCSYASTPEFRRVFTYLHDADGFVLKYLHGDADRSGLIVEGEIVSYKPKTAHLPEEGYLFAFLLTSVQQRDVVGNGFTRGYSGQLTIDSRLIDIK